MKSFKKWYFVVNFKKTCASAVSMDQALEKAYIKPTKYQSSGLFKLFI